MNIRVTKCQENNLLMFITRPFSRINYCSCWFKSFLAGYYDSTNLQRSFSNKEELQLQASRYFCMTSKVLSEKDDDNNSTNYNKPSSSWSSSKTKKVYPKDIITAISTDLIKMDPPKPIPIRKGNVIPPESQQEEEKEDQLSVHIDEKDLNRPIFIPGDTESEDLILTEADLLPPTNCCMSGCPTCVWIEYVEKLTKFYSNPTLGKERIHKDIETIDDANIKAFLIMELRFKGLW